MSLLLDALKKAAEQKAEKSRNAEARRQASEEAGAPQENASEANEVAQQTRSEDTQLDQQKSDQTQNQPVAEENNATDDTELTAGVLDQTLSKQDPANDSSTGDETQLTGRDTDSTLGKDPVSENRGIGDDTEIQQLGSDASQFDQPDDDDTQVLMYGSESEESVDAMEPGGESPEESDDLQLGDKKPTGLEDTELTDAGHIESEESRLPGGKEQVAAEDTDISVIDISRVFNEDETLLLTDDDVGAFMGDDESGKEAPKPAEKPQQKEEISAQSVVEDDTNIKVDSEPGEIEADDDPTAVIAGEGYSVSLFDADYPARKADIDESDLSLADQTFTQSTGGDYSISLFDEDVTPLAPGVKKSADPGREDTDPELSLADKTGLRSLTLIDISESSLRDDDVTGSRITQPSQFPTDLDPPSKTITRHDTTSTQTYASDNYDRTLQRAEVKNESNYFTGMKSESGDILTAEHAKKIFHSKSSSQRMDNLKAYSGVVVVILAIFASLAVYQLGVDSEKIESSLRPLKRDPMPGLIQKVADQRFTNVLAATSGSEIDARALELVENAERIVGAEEVAVDLGATETSLSGTNETVENTESPQMPSEPTISDGVQELASVSNETTIDNNLIHTGDDHSADDSPGLMQITSKNTITEIDRLLQEAYAAYQRGDDELALLKYNQVLDLDPGNRNALLARAAINIQSNGIEAAILDYQTLLLANPKDSLAMSSLTAIANYSPQQSESMLKLMIRDEPNSPYLNFALGNVYGAQNRWPEAQGQYFTAFENNPDDPNYAYNLAVSLEHISQPRLAISYYQRALDNYNNGLATFNRDVVDQRLEMLRQL